jgi:hypothetical protein
MSYGDPLIIIQEPLSAAILGLAAIMLALGILPKIRRSRERVFAE